MSPFNLPPTPEQLKQAADLFADGASQREVQRTTGISRDTLRQKFPRAGWTFVEGGEFRALTRDAGNNPWKLPAFHNWAEKGA